MGDLRSMVHRCCLSGWLVYLSGARKSVYVAYVAAIHYTVIRSCALNGVEPWQYLADVLPKLAGDWPNNRLDELLPRNSYPVQKDS